MANVSTSLALTPARRRAKELLTSEELAAQDKQAVERLKETALRQLAAVSQLEQKAALGAIISGLTLHRVKASLKHGEWYPWLKANRQIPTTGGDLPSVSMCQYYMRLATVFVEKTKVTLPHLLACPGDQLALEMPGSDAAKGFVEKLESFVGSQSLNDLFDRYKIKERQEPQGASAKGGKLGHAEPEKLSPAEALEQARVDARKWFQEQLVWWHRHFEAERSFRHLPDEATTDGELTLGQFKRLLTETLKAIETEEKARRKGK